MEVEVILTAGALASAIWQGVKWLIRTAKKDIEWSLPVKYNVAIVAVLSYLVTPLLAYLEIGEYALPNSLEDFARQLLVVVLQAIVGMGVHEIAFSRATSAVRIAEWSKDRGFEEEEE